MKTLVYLTTDRSAIRLEEAMIENRAPRDLVVDKGIKRVNAEMADLAYNVVKVTRKVKGSILRGT